MSTSEAPAESPFAELVRRVGRFLPRVVELRRSPDAAEVRMKVRPEAKAADYVRAVDLVGRLGYVVRPVVGELGLLLSNEFRVVRPGEPRRLATPVWCSGFGGPDARDPDDHELAAGTLVRDVEMYKGAGERGDLWLFDAHVGGAWCPQVAYEKVNAE